jgi:hypothetical protein
VAIRGSVVLTTVSFVQDALRLASRVPDLDRAIDDLSTMLALDYDVPAAPVMSADAGMQFALLWVGGATSLAVAYRQTRPSPSPAVPYRTITLLRLVEVAASRRGDAVA